MRLPQLLDWLATAAPDVVCLQELKLEDHKFPLTALESVGYSAVFSGQKTYNGVAIVSRLPLTDVSIGIPGYDDPQRRVIAATVGGVRVVCVYVPNGQALDSEKYPYKLEWLSRLEGWLAEELQRWPQLVLTGDFNIAPEDQDVYDPQAWAGSVLVSAPERAALQRLLALGLTDSFRQLHPQTDGAFSWWDYRQAAFRRNLGLRIDLVLLSQPLLPHLAAAFIDKTPRSWERPSDHTPVGIDLHLA